MNLDIKDILELNDNKKYIITSKVIYEGDTYLFIADINESANVKVCRVTIHDDKTNLVVINNDELVKILVPLFEKELVEFAN